MGIVEAFAAAGVINGLLLSLMAAVAGRGDRRAGWLAATLATMSFAVAAILISHLTDGATQLIAVGVEQTMTLAAGPAVLQYVRAAMGLPARGLPAFAPAALYAPGAGLLFALGRYDPPSDVWLVLWQAGFTVAAAVIFLRHRTRGDRSTHGFAWPTALLSTLGVIHLAQAARMSGLAGGSDRNLVVVVAAICIFGFLVLVLSTARFVEQRGRRYAKSNQDQDQLAALFAEADAAVDRLRLHRRPDLTLADCAAAVGARDRSLTQALSQAGGTSFNAWIAGKRAEDAARLLRETAAEAPAVEALGMEAGFRSRSVFYAAFHKRFGCTPAQYRRTIMSGPRGTDTKPRAGSSPTA